MSAPNATTTVRRTRPNTIDAFNAGRCFDQRRPQKVAETTSKSALGFATAFGLARWQAGSQGYWLTSALEGSECFLAMNGPKRQTRQSQIHKTNCYCHGDHHILDHGNAAFCKLLCRMFSPATHSNDCPCTNFHQHRPSQNEIFFRKECARLSKRAKMSKRFRRGWLSFQEAAVFRCTRQGRPSSL